MTRLAQLLHYTSLSQALFSKPLSPIGPTQPSRGNVTRRIARWTFQDGHLVSFYLFIFLLVCLLSYFPMLSTLYCLYLETAVLLFSSVVFIFVILVCCFDYCPTPTPLSLSATAAGCVWLNSVQVATAYRWDVYHTRDARRITNTLLSCLLLLLS